MLKMTSVKLDLIIDIDMQQFIEKCMRGGVNYITKRYSKIMKNIGYLMIKVNHLNKAYMTMQIIFMGRKFRNIFLLVVSSGQKNENDWLGVDKIRKCNPEG